MSTPLQDALRTAGADRDRLANLLADLQKRARQLDVDRAAADVAADTAAEAHRERLAAIAAGEPVDATATRATRDTTAAHLAELTEATTGLQQRVAALAKQHDGAARKAAHARKLLAVAIAERREIELRAAASAFAGALTAWRETAATAEAAHYEETGQPGVQPVHYEGRAGLLVTNADGGIPALFLQQGLTVDLRSVNLRPITEATLLDTEVA